MVRFLGHIFSGLPVVMLLFPDLVFLSWHVFPGMRCLIFHTSFCLIRWSWEKTRQFSIRHYSVCWLFLTWSYLPLVAAYWNIWMHGQNVPFRNVCIKCVWIVCEIGMLFRDHDTKWSHAKNTEVIENVYFCYFGAHGNLFKLSISEGKKGSIEAKNTPELKSSYQTAQLCVCAIHCCLLKLQISSEKHFSVTKLWEDLVKRPEPVGVLGPEVLLWGDEVVCRLLFGYQWRRNTSPTGSAWRELLK